jgi:hypothetical protein
VKEGEERLSCFSIQGFVGNALGPMMATTILAQFNLLTLYLTISGLTLVSLCAFWHLCEVAIDPARYRVYEIVMVFVS